MSFVDAIPRNPTTPEVRLTPQGSSSCLREEACSHPPVNARSGEDKHPLRGVACLGAGAYCLRRHLKLASSSTVAALPQRRRRCRSRSGQGFLAACTPAAWRAPQHQSKRGISITTTMADGSTRTSPTAPLLFALHLHSRHSSRTIETGPQFVPLTKPHHALHTGHALVVAAQLRLGTPATHRRLCWVILPHHGIIRAANGVGLPSFGSRSQPSGSQRE